MKEQAYNPIFEMAEQTMNQCEQAFRTGLQLQDEARQRFFTGAGMPDWQRTFSTMTGMMESMTPKQRGDVMELMTRNLQIFTDFYMSAAQLAQKSAALDARFKWMDMARRSMESAQSSFEDMTELRDKAIETWTECVNASFKAANPRD